MHGFLNVLLTTSILRNDLNSRYAIDLLKEMDPQSVQLDSDHLLWKQHTVTAADILRGRNLFQAIGTCSLDEPIEDLQKIGWL